MNMLRVTVLVCLLQAPVSTVIADDVLPGQWSITVTMTAAGMKNELGPLTRTQCLTLADAQNPAELFSDSGSDCTFGDKKYQGSHFTFSVKCSGVVPMQGEGEINFSAASFEGNMAIQANVPDLGPIQTKSRVAGSRLGDCRKE